MYKRGAFKPRVNRMKPVLSSVELQKRLGSRDLVIIDCRFDLARPKWGREAYAAGHIPGAVYADLDRDLAAPVTSVSGRHPLPSPSEAEALFRRLGVNSHSTVVVYDQGSGAFAARAWWMLRWLGHTQVQVLDGGWSDWNRDRRPVETRTASSTDGDFEARENDDRVVSAADVQKLLDDGVLLVDARDADRFAGRQEPIDAVAGHIPGAINLPFSRFLTERQTLVSETEARALWEDVAALKPRSRWIAMCGSGVTACHLALTAELAGLPEPKLYAGSWSEWIRDPERPTATGAA